MTELRPLFVPKADAIARSQMTAFMRFCDRAADDARAFHCFSVAEMRRFWSLFLRWSELAIEGSPEPVCVGDRCENAVFFPNLRLSYVENLLRGDDSRPALRVCGENGAAHALDRRTLRVHVAHLARALARLGVRAGDRVAAVVQNDTDAVIACLAATALGATWSAVSTDLAAFAMLNRFRALEPHWLFAHTGAPGPAALPPLRERIAEVIAALPSLRGHFALDDEPMRAWLDNPDDADFEWPRFPFNHPLFVLFTSGTTGPPKCILHGAGGTLLEHHKEHRLHCDLGPGDRLFFQTSTGWMMWNWQLSALACGAEIVVYPGVVGYPETLWKLVSQQDVTVFGTGPGYLHYCETARYEPRALPLGALRSILSTGAILFDSQFEWAWRMVKHVPVQSISGGTDIIGCFVLGHPNLPVHAGQIQSLSLGLDVRAYGGEQDRRHGELVCAAPFPSRPLGFLGDADGKRFHEAYFSQHEGVWTHGDFLELTPRGGARIGGRCDGLLNIRGIRIGPAEIYQILQSVQEIAESMAVEQATAGGGRLVLLVVLKPGATLDDALVRSIRKLLAQRASAAHVPSVIVAVDELPTTHSGKRSERAASDAINGRAVRNREALRNPDALDALWRHPLLRERRS